ncbi:hypothetical protein GLF_0104 [Gluconobacter frateurii NBRC 101659]|nr:hypothetical protein GLF_0104 [Gluconobacter frateurii NBRC 101659]
MTGLSLASSGLARTGHVHGLFPFCAGRMVTDGAARSGRRTPEPHVWPAAPLQFMCGDGWRGAAMGENVGAWLRARREEMREEAETDGLSLHDALVYYGRDDLLWDVVHDELSPTVAGEREFGDFLRGELMRSLRERFIDGALIAYAADPHRPGYRIKIPSEDWGILFWRDESALCGAYQSPLDYLGRPSRFHGDVDCYRDVRIKSVSPLAIFSGAPQSQTDKRSVLASSQKAKRGYDDDRLLEKMKAGFESGEYPNLWQAACACAPEAGGSTEEQAREKRLVRKFKGKYRE